MTLTRKTPLRRETPLRANPSPKRPKPVSVVSDAQRKAVKGHSCLVCGTEPVDPAHVIPRGLCPDLDGDPRAVVPLCRAHHIMYDAGRLSLLEFLEPGWRDRLAYAVERVGLLTTLYRTTNEHWSPERVAA